MPGYESLRLHSPNRVIIGINDLVDEQASTLMVSSDGTTEVRGHEVEIHGYTVLLRGEATVEADPTVPLGIASKQYVDAAGGGGTTILSGTGTPTAGTGSTGNYYLDEAADILYGPKASGAGPASLFTASTPPAAASADDPNVNTAVEFSVTVPATLTQIKFWQASSNTNAGTRKFGLWDLTAGAFVAYGPDVTPTLNAGAWVASTLVIPYALVPNRRYRAVVWHPNGRYAATAGYFASGAGASGVTSGALTAPSNAGATAVGNGTFAYDSVLTNTTTAFNGDNYWVDVTVATSDPWPVALRGTPTNFSVGTTAPSSPAVNDVWIDTSQ
jgi:hypothetical protein